MSPHGPALFVHGNPETSAVWGPLLGALGRDDVVCLSPPGFGAPLPRGFEPTMTGYRDWLIARLEAFRQPVDLVGHDWGGGHVFNVAMTRPDLIRSWVSDALGLFDPRYEWHPLARIWRTPGDGEQLVADMITAPLEQRTAAMDDLGIASPGRRAPGRRPGCSDGPRHPGAVPIRRKARAGRGGPPREHSRGAARPGDLAGRRRHHRLRAEPAPRRPSGWRRGGGTRGCRALVDGARPGRRRTRAHRVLVSALLTRTINPVKS